MKIILKLGDEKMLTLREKAIKKVEKKLKFSPYFWYKKKDYSRFVKVYLVNNIVYTEIFDFRLDKEHYNPFSTYVLSCDCMTFLDKCKSKVFTQTEKMIGDDWIEAIKRKSDLGYLYFNKVPCRLLDVKTTIEHQINNITEIEVLNLVTNRSEIIPATKFSLIIPCWDKNEIIIDMILQRGEKV